MTSAPAFPPRLAHSTIGRTGRSADQVLMRAGFGDAAAFHDIDLVRQHGSGEAVGDDDRCPPGSQAAEARQPIRLRPWIHGAGRFVQDQDGGAADEGARQGDSLPLPHAQLGAVGERLAQQIGIACRQPFDRHV